MMHSTYSLLNQASQHQQALLKDAGTQQLLRQLAMPSKGKLPWLRLFFQLGLRPKAHQLRTS